MIFSVDSTVSGTHTREELHLLALTSSVLDKSK